MQLKSTELRRLNLISINGKSTVVDGVTEWGVNPAFYEGGYGDAGQLSYEGEFENDKIEGVPITDDLLLAAGYEKQDDYWYDQERITRIRQMQPDTFLFELGYSHEDGEDWRCVNAVEYAHKLQNIFFEIMDDELVFAGIK